MNVKFLPRKITDSKGFTLIELIVVIAILGVLASVLITIIDPLDKINSANDTGVISSIAQFGAANDAYAASHNNSYVAGAAVDTALGSLKTAGESKSDTYSVPGGYTVNYAAAPATCTIDGTVGGYCTSYAFWVSALKSKKNTSGAGGAGNPGPIYVFANGQGCFKASGTVITAATTCP